MQSISLKNNEEQRLDVALTAEMGLSRAQVQKIIKEGRVTVDGAPATAHTPVSSTNVVEIADAVLSVEVPKEMPKLDILFEKDDVIVLNKPAGALVHPTGAMDASEPTLMDAVLAHVPAMKDVGGDPLRSGVVHRLDREASGVIIFAKNETAHAHLKVQFKERLTEKIYDVLVLGNVKDEHGTITFPIARSETRSRMAARPTSQEGKEAITHYDVVTRYSSSTRLRVRIETGRTHQIRAHMFAIEHPVAGDTLYVNRNKKPMDLGRLFLHAASLALTLPSGEHMTFTAPLPDTLEDVLAHLKLKPV